MPLLRRAALLLAIAASGCNKDEGPTGPHALDFDGEASCATAAVGSANLGSELTVEGWVRAEPDALYRDNVLLAWPGAVALWQDPDGVLYFTDGTEADAGPSGFGDWMDGSLHHVAGMWVDGQSAVYLDGERLGINTLAEFGVAPEGQIFAGCWPERDMVHEGLLDEVRISGVARYDFEGFDPPAGAFVQDADTFLLWHMDEGEGDVTVDAVEGVQLLLDGVEWQPFTLSGGGSAE